MASSSGNSSGTATTTTTGLLTSGSDDGEFKRLMDQRKRRRMESNRESAKRSRMRKQMHLDELAETAMRMTSENARLAAGITIAAGQVVSIKAENSVLRAQLVELSCRLDSLNDILLWVEPGRSLGSVQAQDSFGTGWDWNSICVNQPIAAVAASHDMFQY